MRLASRLRNVMVCLQCAFFAAMMCIMGPRFFPLCAGFGVTGVGVLLLTLMTGEPWVQKTFFALAGGAGTAALLTLSVFHVLMWSGHPPGGDGGGITLPMLLIVCPITFVIGVVGIALRHSIAVLAAWRARRPAPRDGCRP